MEKEYDVTITIRVKADDEEQAKLRAAYQIASGEARMTSAKIKQVGPQVFQD